MPLQRDVIRAMICLRGKDIVRKFMIDYYNKTLEGKREKNSSGAHRSKRTEELVDMILSDVESEMI
jgi:hypothetical protein